MNSPNLNFINQNLHKKELYGSGHDRKKLNTYLKSALKTVLKNGLRIFIFEFFFEKTNFFYWDSQRPKELFVEKNKYEHTKEILDIITDEELE